MGTLKRYVWPPGLAKMCTALVPSTLVSAGSLPSMPVLVIAHLWVPIWGMSLAGAPHDQIIDAVRKKDGTCPSLRAVGDILSRKREHPEWRGEDTHSGRPKALTDAQREQLVDLVFAERGKAKVTVKFCKKRLRFLRAVGRHTVERELQDAGLRWLRRRGKTFVPRPVKLARVEYAASLKRKWHSVLDRYAYTDGTTFYLARSSVQSADKKRLALGKHVWRMANGKDGLWDDVVEEHPKYSPDLNAIEGWWRVLRERLEQTEPEEMEGREAFIARLRRTVLWLNMHRSAHGLYLCTHQKERAGDVEKLLGAKTKW